MSKTILAEVNGFTPVIDTILQEVGVMSAVVFGRVWRYCQMKDGVCNASIETIAEELKVDRTTIIKHIANLIAHGYIQDHTPDQRNRPHIYSDTGKASIGVTIDAKAPPIYGGVKKVTGVGNSNTNAQAYAPDENFFMQVHEEGVVNLDTTVENSDSTVVNSDTASSRKFRLEDSIKKEDKRLKYVDAKTASTPPEKPDVLTGWIIPNAKITDTTLPEWKADCSDFPEDLRPFVQKFCDLWKIDPPSIKLRSEFSWWMTETNRLKKACGEYRVQVIEVAYNTWLKEPFTVGHPGAIVITCQAEAGKLRKNHQPANSSVSLAAHSPEEIQQFKELSKRQAERFNNLNSNP